MLKLRTQLRLSILSSWPLPAGVTRTFSVDEKGVIAVTFTSGPFSGQAVIPPARSLLSGVRAELARLGERVRAEARALEWSFSREAEDLAELLVLQRLDLVSLQFERELQKAAARWKEKAGGC